MFDGHPNSLIFVMGRDLDAIRAGSDYTDTVLTGEAFVAYLVAHGDSEAEALVNVEKHVELHLMTAVPMAHNSDRHP